MKWLMNARLAEGASHPTPDTDAAIAGNLSFWQKA